MKMNAAENYYVYCYIDPRTGKEFYYGKGNRGRKLAHLRTQGKSEKAKRIRQIRAAGAEPIIRVIAAGLTQDHALLVEAALIWKLGEELTNKISGHYTGNFRPQNTLDKEREGFDFSHRSHFFNVGEHFDKGQTGIGRIATTTSLCQRVTARGLGSKRASFVRVTLFSHTTKTAKDQKDTAMWELEK
jgi:hypothetical protein